MPNFFDEQLPCSKVKANIVSQYFWKWANVMIKQSEKIAYVDFFCGPGMYADGKPSTPLLILEAAISHEIIRQKLVTYFNDDDNENVLKLQAAIKAIPDIDKLARLPKVLNLRIGESEEFEKLKMLNKIPSLFFLDPFGYKGLTLDLIATTVKDWGCDCIFFFNYNRINGAISNPFMTAHVDALFGKDDADMLRRLIGMLSPPEREKLIMATFSKSLNKVKGKYSISFKFYLPDMDKTSHFLIFVTKHQLGYTLMKETMAANSSLKHGVPTYECRPPQPPPLYHQTSLFGLAFEDNPIKDLAAALLSKYTGVKKKVIEIFYDDHIGKPFILANYKTALIELEKQDKISASVPVEKRRKHKGVPTMGDQIEITFK